MIAAAKIPGMSFAFHHDRAAVGADVGQAAQIAVVIRGEDERLAQAAVEERKRQHTTRSFDTRGVADVLPAAREDAVFLRLEILGI